MANKMEVIHHPCRCVIKENKICGDMTTVEKDIEFCYIHKCEDKTKQIVSLLASLNSLGYDTGRKIIHHKNKMDYPEWMETLYQTYLPLSTSTKNTPFELMHSKHHLEFIELITPFIKKNNGYIFGGAVRDTIVNAEPFKDLDICFKNLSDETNFINDIRTLSGITCIVENEIMKYRNFTNKAISYNLTIAYGITFDIDILISDNLPVNDSFVNELIYDGQLKHISGNKDILQAIVFMIKNKFLYPMENKKLDKLRSLIFEQRGWILMK